MLGIRVGDGLRGDTAESSRYTVEQLQLQQGGKDEEEAKNRLSYTFSELTGLGNPFFVHSWLVDIGSDGLYKTTWVKFMDHDHRLHFKDPGFPRIPALRDSTATPQDRLSERCHQSRREYLATYRIRNGSPHMTWTEGEKAQTE